MSDPSDPTRDYSPPQPTSRTPAGSASYEAEQPAIPLPPPGAYQTSPGYGAPPSTPLSGGYPPPSQPGYYPPPAGGYPPPPGGYPPSAGYYPPPVGYYPPPPPTFEAQGYGRIQLNVGTPQALKNTSPWAIWSLVCAIALAGVGAIPAVIFGHMALRQIKENPQLKGRGMAIAGLVIGYTTIALAILAGLIEVMFVVYQLSSH